MTVHPATAIVVGVRPGLGQALYRHLADTGYRVAWLVRGTAVSRDSAAKLGSDRSRTIACNLTGVVQVDAVVGEVEAQWGPVSSYACNATPFHRSAFSETEPSIFAAFGGP